MPQQARTDVFRFGAFELEPQHGILRKHGVRVRLQEQPFRVLLALIERQGELVTRDELREQAWAGAAYGDFDHSLNIAINKIREALGDSADTPRYVETMPRRGYRFVAAVEGAPAPTVPEPGGKRMPRWLAPASITVAALAAAAGVAALLGTPSSPQLEWHRLTNDNSVKIGPVLSDGTRLFFQSRPYNCFECQTHLSILQVPVAGGEPTPLPVAPPPGPYYDLLDITPNGQELLVRSSETIGNSAAGALWTVRIVDGTNRRVGSFLASSARYSPDGTQIVFTAGWPQELSSLWIAASDGSAPRRLLELKREFIAVVPCWSPDGKRIEFGQVHSVSGQMSAWEVMADGRGPRRTFPSLSGRHRPAGWTPDGRLLFTSPAGLWMAQQPPLFSRDRPKRVQLSSEEPWFSGLLHARDSRAFYDVGTIRLGELQRFDARSRTWESHLGGISADEVEYSRDGRSVVYVTYPDGDLWARGADGSRPTQLTRAPMRALVARWSPDGRIIAFSAKSAPDRPSTIYLEDAAGGNVRPVPCSKACEGVTDLAWMPDGKRVIYDVPSDSNPASGCLRIVDPASGVVRPLAGSETIFSPRVSPDGATMAALVGAPSGDRLMLYNFSTGVWERIQHPGTAEWPSWSHDSQSVWYFDEARSVIVRYDVHSRRSQEMPSLRREDMSGSVGFWFALTTKDEPMSLRRRDVQQIYELTWKE